MVGSNREQQPGGSCGRLRSEVSLRSHGRYCMRSQPGGFAPQGHLATSVDLTVTTMLMASGGQRPGMLLNTLQYTGRSLLQRTVWSKKPTVLMLRNPAPRQGGVGSEVLLQAHSENQAGRGAGGNRELGVHCGGCNGLGEELMLSNCGAREDS